MVFLAFLGNHAAKLPGFIIIMRLGAYRLCDPETLFQILVVRMLFELSLDLANSLLGIRLFKDTRTAKDDDRRCYLVVSKLPLGLHQLGLQPNRASIRA